MSPWLGRPTTKSAAISTNLFKFRYPFAACEILSLDHGTIIEFFFPENTLTIEETTVEEVEVEEEVEIDDEPESTQPSGEPSDLSSAPEAKEASPEKEEEKEAPAEDK